MKTANSILQRREVTRRYLIKKRMERSHFLEQIGRVSQGLLIIVLDIKRISHEKSKYQRYGQHSIVRRPFWDTKISIFISTRTDIYFLRCYSLFTFYCYPWFLRSGSTNK